MLTLGNQAVHDSAHLCRLPLALRTTASGLGLEVIHQYMDHRAVRCVHLVLRAIPAENGACLIFRVDIGPDRLDLEVVAHHDRDVDSTFVIPIDKHDVTIESPEQFLVEPHERRSVLRFDNPDDVGVDVLDDPGSHPRGGLVGRLLGQLDPADPFSATIGDDLDVLGRVLGLAIKFSAIFSQPGPAWRLSAFAPDRSVVVDAVDVELNEQVTDSLLIGGAVGNV